MCRSENLDECRSTRAKTLNGVPSNGPSLIVRSLSLVWFSLCTSLVMKENDLIAVFFSFAASFIIAMYMMGKDIRKAFHVVLEGDNLKASERIENHSTKLSVGVILSLTSLAILACHTSETHSVGVKGFSLIQKSAEFHAMANMAGYLAFDLWFDCMCCRQDPPRIRNILEDVTTLTIFCTILTKWDGLDMSSSHLMRPSIAAWAAYKIFRFSIDSPSVTDLTEGNSVPIVANAPKENLWRIHGKDFDLEDFVDSHPGGKEAILLGRGRDCTAMFESYHPFTNRHRLVLKRYQAVETKQIPSNGLEENDEFYNVLKERAMKALKENGIDPSKDRAASKSRILYYFTIIALLIHSGSYHAKGNPLGSFFFAVFGWLIGSLGHDSGHFAASRIPFFNDVGVWGMSLLCNPMMWQHQHTFAHHSHTNEFDKDPDLHHFSILLRVHRKFQHESIYNNQTNAFFVILAYALVVFGECIKIPIGMMKTGFLYDMVEYTDQKRPLRAFGMYFHYIGYFALIFVAPFFSAKSNGTAFLCGFIHIVTAGWLFGFFSQINHLNEHSIETEKGSTKSKLLKKSWAAQQVATSNNFATKSVFWYCLSNGLNTQIEHHLFPGLNHCHLHIVQPIVQKTCEEFGVHYKSYETWSEVMGASLEWLHQLSTPV